MEKLKFRSSPTQNPITTGKSTSPYLHNFLKVSFNLLFRFLKFLLQKTLILRFRHIFPRKKNFLADNSEVEELVELKT